jgi:hypothetical protein
MIARSKDFLKKTSVIRFFRMALKGSNSDQLWTLHPNLSNIKIISQIQSISLRIWILKALRKNLGQFQVKIKTHFWINNMFKHKKILEIYRALIINYNNISNQLIKMGTWLSHLWILKINKMRKEKIKISHFIQIKIVNNHMKTFKII